MIIRIFLIDEHRPAREILARRLASMPGLDVVGSTCDGEEAIREIEGLSPDAVLIDTKMKQADGMDICRRAIAADNQASVAVLTSYLDPDERRLAYQAGVDGYLLKDVDTGNLFENTDFYGRYIDCFQCGHYLTAVEEDFVRLNTPLGRTHTLPSKRPVRVLEEIAA